MELKQFSPHQIKPGKYLILINTVFQILNTKTLSDLSIVINANVVDTCCTEERVSYFPFQDFSSMLVQQIWHHLVEPWSPRV